MKYLVLARRYRPQLFRDVIGQEAVLRTLKNALSYKRVAQAYLFCGSRGIGKTTLARLFAKALNCQALTPDSEPCNLCPSCIEILSGQSLDVIEIDGASNRGIDDIRTLNETVAYAPSHGKYKIYIIDEVHMLTKEAFNALLKTLEEPPEKAKFFFATTEPHKVPQTIVSRCQRFDLQRLNSEQIAGKLQAIAADLKREASPEALHRISQFAQGSLRDAESLFDQILCFAEGQVRMEHVESALGLVPDEIFAALDTAFSEGRAAFAFELVEKLFQMGKDLGHFTEQLIDHYRRLAIYRLSPQTSNSKAETAKLYTQAQLCFILDTLLSSYTQLQKSPMQRVSLEALLLKILRSKHRIPIEVLARRLSELEEKLVASKQQEPLQDDALDSNSAGRKQGQIDKKSSEKEDNTTDCEDLPKEHEKCELEPVPFLSQLAKAKPSETPAPQKLLAEIRVMPKEATVSQESIEETQSQVHTETLLRFAAVELEGTLQIER